MNSDRSNSTPELGKLVIRAVLRYPISIALISCAGLALGLFAAFTKVNYYSSEAKLQVRLGAREQTTPEGAIAADFQQRGSDISIGDVVHVFNDPMLHRRVAAIVGAEKIGHFLDPRLADTSATPAPIKWIHSFQAWWLQRDDTAHAGDSRTDDETRILKVLEQGLRITSRPTDKTITLTFNAQSPDLAQEIVLAYLDVFRARHKEVYESTNQLAFVQGQLAAARATAVALRAEFSQASQKNQIYDIDSQIARIEESIEDIDGEIENDEIARASARERLEAVKAQLADAEPLLSLSEVSTSRSVDPDYAPLTTELRQTQAAIAEIARQYPENSVGYLTSTQALRKRAEQVEAELASHGPFMEIEGESVTFVENPAYFEAETARLALETELIGLESRLQLKRAYRDRLQPRRVALRELEPEYKRLEEAVRRSESSAAQLIPAVERAQWLHTIETQEELSNLKVIQNATRNPKKVGPDRKKLTVLGLLGGGLLGLLLAILRRILDQRLRFVDEVESVTGLQVLGVVPHVRRWPSSRQLANDQKVKA